MKFNIKKAITLSLLTGSMFLAACNKDFLDLKPQQSVFTDDVFTNINAANLLLGLLGAGADLTPPARGGVIRPGADIWTQFRQPVLVRPSAAVIASATERLSGNDLAAGTVCAICQDTIAGNAQARRLRACQHSYHVGCIDQWFEQNVHCPVCRYDIRETPST
jgi:hypothetical protein